MAYRFLRFPGGKTKAVTLSYDDGCPADARLWQTINRYGLKCTFNLNSERLLAGESLTVEQAKGLLADGHEVAVHGAQHRANGVTAPVDGIRDVLLCREALEQTFERIIRGMAYPDTGINRFMHGVDYQTVRSYLTALGIVYARKTGGDNNLFELPTDWLAWGPTAHHNNPKLLEYIDEFLSIDVDALYRSKRYPRLFYLWGHAFEFDNNSNWELLDQIGEKLGGHEDIWYATNIEIYDYVAAYEALIRSADGRRVYNPGLIPVWFADAESLFCVNPGETILIP